MKHTDKKILILLILISQFSFSQSKVQKLYESENYLKCINICTKNIKKNQDKLNSYYYKSLSIAEFNNNEKIKSIFSDPVSEALKGISKLEKHKRKKPSDYFYSEHRYGIDKIKRYAERTADSVFEEGNTKYAKKIYSKLMTIYPENNLYLYKYSKIFGFNSKEVIKNNKNISEKNYHERIFELIDNCKKYFKNNAEKELTNTLDILYNDTACDLETASVILVKFPQKFGKTEKYEKEVKRFIEKYWQIDMLFEVNNKRLSGCACDKVLIDPKPPLTLSNCLCRTAQKQAEYMNKEDYFSHINKDGSTPWNRADKEGCSADAENIATNNTNKISLVVNQWMNSKGHCKNIMGFHTKAGFGNAGKYWVQMFK